MERASKVMYSIANVFNYILAILAIFGIVMTALAMANVLPKDVDTSGLGTGSLVYFIIMFLVAIITIALVRKAKSSKSSKGWDVLFLVLGILDLNVFYILGGIFGIVARR